MKITNEYGIWKLSVTGYRARFYASKAQAAAVANRWTRHLGCTAPCTMGTPAVDQSLTFGDGYYAK